MLILNEDVCVVCGNKHEDMKRIRISQDRGGISSSQSVKICDSCFDNMYVNDYGFEFVVIDKELHMKHPINGCYELVTSQGQIDDAFNPDYAAFIEWVNKR